MSQENIVTVFNVIETVNQVGFDKLDSFAKQHFLTIINHTKKGSKFFNSPFLQNDLELLQSSVKSLNNFLVSKKLVKSTESPLIRIQDKITSKDVLQLIEKVNISQLDFPLLLKCLNLIRLKDIKSESDILADEDLVEEFDYIIERFTLLNKHFGGLPKKEKNHTGIAGMFDWMNPVLAHKKDLGSNYKTTNIRLASLTVFNILEHTNVFKGSKLPFDIEFFKEVYVFMLKKASNRPVNISEDVIGSFGLLQTIEYLNYFGESNNLLYHIDFTELVTFSPDIPDLEFVNYLHRLIPEHYSEEIEQKIKLFYIATLHGTFYDPNAYTPEFKEEFAKFKKEIIKASITLEGLMVIAELERDVDLLGGFSKFQNWIKQRKFGKHQNQSAELGDIDLRKGKKGFEFYEGVINLVRFWDAIENVDRNEIPFNVSELINIYSRNTDNGNNVELLLDQPVARITIQMCCDFINDNFAPDHETNLKPLKLVLRFNGEPSLDDKLELIKMVDGSDYSFAFHSRIQVLLFALNETPLGDGEDFPEVFVKEVDEIYERLSNMMNLFGGIPVMDNKKKRGVDGTGNEIPQKGIKSLAQKTVDAYNKLSLNAKPSKAEAKDLLEQIQELIVNLKIRKTDPAAELIDEVQKNLIHFLQGKIKTLKAVSDNNLDGFLFGIEPISNKHKKKEKLYSLGNIINRSSKTMNTAYVTVFDFPDKYEKLLNLDLPFDINVLHEFYFSSTDNGNNPLLLIDDPTARVTILIMLDYINHIASKSQEILTKPVLITEFIPEIENEDELFEFIQYVDTKRFPKPLAKQIEILNYSTRKKIYDHFGDGAPSELLYSGQRIMKELRNIAVHFSGIPMLEDDDLSVGVIQNKINKRENRSKQIARKFVESAINTSCAGKSKKEAANYLISELQKITKDSNFQSENARSAIDRVISDLKLITKKKAKASKKEASKSNADLAGWITNSVEFENNAIEHVKPVMSVQEAANLPVNEIPFNDLLHQLFGRPELGFTAMMYGAPGCGKSTLALWMAKQLAIHHGRVLYVSPEQYPKGSLTTLINRMGMANVEGVDLTKHLSDASPQGYDFIFIDSVNSHKIGIGDFIQLKNQHPNKTFFLILQSTKDKSYRGSRDWEHEVDNVIYIEPGKAEVTKARFQLPGKPEIEIPDLIGDNESKTSTAILSQNTVVDLAGVKKRKPKKEEDFSIWTVYDLEIDDLEKTALKIDPDYKSLNEFLEGNPGGLDNIVRDLLRNDFAESNPNVSVLRSQFERIDKGENLISFQIKIHGTRKELEQVTEPNGFLRYDWDNHES